MSTFYFHLLRNGARTSDVLGSEFPDLASAREDALMAGRELAADSILKDGRAGLREGRADDLSCEISDAKGTVLSIVPFLDA